LGLEKIYCNDKRTKFALKEKIVKASKEKGIFILKMKIVS